MAIINLKNGDSDAIIREVGTNTVYVVATNAVSSNSFVSAKDALNNIATVAVSIRKVAWATDSLITISRVVNATSNVAILKLAYAGVMDLDGYGMCSQGPLDFSSANLAVSCASANSTLILKVSKKTVPATDYDPSQLNE